MTTSSPGTAATPTLSLSDTFSDDRRAGRVIGSTGTDGTTRAGVDVERVISIDHGALRIRTLATPGWCRAGIAYGPYRRRSGLAMAALVLNGHNTSQGYELDGVLRRIARWALGVPGLDPAWRRLVRWPRRMRRESIVRHVECWARSRRRRSPRTLMTDNLAVGMFPSEVPANATDEGSAFVMHAANHENGELRCRVGGRPLSCSRNIQNLPIHYIVILREQGAAYYAASLPGAHALGAYPSMRPIAIDAFADDPQVYAGIHQGVLGEIGFSVDTRVRGVRVAHLAGLAEWFGTAHGADPLLGSGPLEGSSATVGGRWRSLSGSFQRTTAGARAIAAGSIGALEAPAPSGLIHVLIECSGAAPAAGLAFRIRDAGNLWTATVGEKGWEIRVRVAGVWSSVAAGAAPALQPGRLSSLQVVDDGGRFGVSLDGVPFQPDQLADQRLGDAVGFGIVASAADAGVLFRELEAHPRAVPIPSQLDFGDSWHELGDRVVLADGFSGPPGDLVGRSAPTGNRDWSRIIGHGVIELASEPMAAARVRASVAAPNPGRTAYAVSWDHPDFADVEIETTPPGAARGKGENGRAGVIFWQDPDNYILINLWLFDDFEGASISSFFYLNGHEDIFDAVWTNVGARVTWGKRYRFRAAFDGLNYLAFVDREPVLSRSLLDVYPGARRLSINRVGICTNWEFQNDTGTLFHSFTARARSGSH